MAGPINPPFRSQEADGYCLPACVQMALAHLDIFRSQEDIAHQLGVIENVGVPASNVLKLQGERFQVQYATDGDLSILRQWLEQNIPIITCVQTETLAYWQGHTTQHAVLVIGMDDATITLLDPAKGGAIHISSDEFFLAWDEMACIYIVIFKLTGSE